MKRINIYVKLTWNEDTFDLKIIQRNAKQKLNFLRGV